MATVTLSLNKPVEVNTPAVSVTTDAPPGTYRLQLIVIDASGAESPPVEQAITIQKTILTRTVVSTQPAPGEILHSPETLK